MKGSTPGLPGGIYTILLTVLIFAIAYFGIERMTPGSFQGVSSPTLFHFIGFSFSNLMTSGTAPMIASSNLAQVISKVQLLTTLLIMVLFISVILTTIRKRYKQDFNGIIDELRIASDDASKYLEDNYDLTVAAAEAWLLEFNPIAIKWALKIRYGEERAKKMCETKSHLAKPISDLSEKSADF